MTIVDQPCVSGHDHEPQGDHGHGHGDQLTAQAPAAEPARTPKGVGVRTAAVATGLFGATALTYVIVHDPSNGSLVPACPVRATTGIWCPGCGLTRSVHAFTNGDPVKAFKYNLFMLPVMLSLGILYGSWALRSFGVNVGNPAFWVARRPKLAVGVITVLFGYMLIRNLPGFEFLIGQ